MDLFNGRFRFLNRHFVQPICGNGKRPHFAGETLAGNNVYGHTMFFQNRQNDCIKYKIFVEQLHINKARSIQTFLNSSTLIYIYIEGEIF